MVRKRKQWQRPPRPVPQNIVHRNVAEQNAAKIVSGNRHAAMNACEKKQTRISQVTNGIEERTHPGQASDIEVMGMTTNGVTCRHIELIVATARARFALNLVRCTVYLSSLARSQ